MAMWGGRFTEATLAEFRDFNDSLSFDYQLALQDIAASRAWAAGLLITGALSCFCAALRRLASAYQDTAASAVSRPCTAVAHC